MSRASCCAVLVTLLGACSVPAPRAEYPPPSVRELLRENRQLNLAWLKLYADRGEFPINDDPSSGTIPFFLDGRGTACAVAHLMRQAGLESEVQRIARDDNHVRIGDVEDGPVLDWIVVSGLTREECAWIQPSYRRPVRIEIETVVPDHTWAGIRLRRPEAFVVPREYLQRTAIPERQRIRSHLVHVHGTLRRDSMSSMAAAKERLIHHAEVQGWSETEVRSRLLRARPPRVPVAPRVREPHPYPLDIRVTPEWVLSLRSFSHDYDPQSGIRPWDWVEEMLGPWDEYRWMGY